MMELLKRLWQEEKGQDLTEYALLLVLISLVAIVAIRTLGLQVSDVFTSASKHVSGGTSPRTLPT